MTTLRDALADLLENHELPVDEAADRHIAPGFRQRTNGQWDDRAGFLARIRHLRSNTRDVTITVLDEITDGSRYAERHIIDLLGADGRRVVHEVYVFASLGPDGRFERIEEATVMAGPTD
jgi:1,6-anhydro-N-acetylmuramate kinase